MGSFLGARLWLDCVGIAKQFRLEKNLVTGKKMPLQQIKDLEKKIQRLEAGKLNLKSLAKNGNRIFQS